MGATRREIQTAANGLGFAVSERLLLDLVGEGIIPGPERRGRYATWPDETLEHVVEIMRVGLRRHPQRRLYFFLCDLVDSPDMDIPGPVAERVRQDLAQVFLFAMRATARTTFGGGPSIGQIQRAAGIVEPLLAPNTKSMAIRSMKQAYGYSTRSSDVGAPGDLLAFVPRRKSKNDSADDVPFLATLAQPEGLSPAFEHSLRSWARKADISLARSIILAVATYYDEAEDATLFKAIETWLAEAPTPSAKRATLYRALFYLTRVPLATRWWSVLAPLAGMIGFFSRGQGDASVRQRGAAKKSPAL